MSPTRRDLLKLAAVAPAFAMPTAVRATVGAPVNGNPAHFSFTLGETKLTVISDGYFSLPMNMFGINASPEEVQAFMAAHYLPTDANYAHTNHLLVEKGDAKLLVDVGSGHRFFDTAGRLAANLDAIGIGLDDITHVVITHAHPDHIWGIRDEFDEPLFPSAEYTLGQVEHDYWMQDGLVDRVAPEDQQFVLGAVNSITADGVDWRLLTDQSEVIPGVTLIDTPGHTPGHMSVLVTDGDQSLLAIGDAMNHAWMNFAHPDWYNASDTDGPLAVTSRKRLLDMAAADRIPVLGYHFPFPGVGHVMAEGDSYRFIPALWQF